MHRKKDENLDAEGVHGYNFTRRFPSETVDYQPGHRSNGTSCVHGGGWSRHGVREPTRVNGPQRTRRRTKR